MTELTKKWYFLEQSNVENGPHTESFIKELAAKGIISKQTYVWHEGLAEWVIYESVFPETILAPTNQSKKKETALVNDQWWDKHRFGIWMAFALITSFIFASKNNIPFNVHVAEHYYTPLGLHSTPKNYTVGLTLLFVIASAIVWVFGPIYSRVTKKPFPWIFLTVTSSIILFFIMILFMLRIHSDGAVPILGGAALALTAYLKATIKDN